MYQRFWRPPGYLSLTGVLKRHRRGVLVPLGVECGPDIKTIDGVFPHPNVEHAHVGVVVLGLKHVLNVRHRLPVHLAIHAVVWRPVHDVLQGDRSTLDETGHLGTRLSGHCHEALSQQRRPRKQNAVVVHSSRRTDREDDVSGWDRMCRVSHDEWYGIAVLPRRLLAENESSYY